MLAVLFTMKELVREALCLPDPDSLFLFYDIYFVFPLFCRFAPDAMEERMEALGSIIEHIQPDILMLQVRTISDQFQLCTIN